MAELEITTSGPDQTDELAQACAKLIAPGDVIALVGPLGAGKTRFVQGLARGLGVSGYVRSPSFTLLHEYRGRIPLYHIDAFRLEGSCELDDIGAGDYIGGAGVTAVEWADKVKACLPPLHLRIEITTDPDFPDTRRLRFLPFGPRFRKMVEELRRCWY